MAQEWQELTKLTGNKSLVIEKVQIVDSNISIEGDFELPPLARLNTEDQVFVAAFVKCHGSIKQMESYFGVSYPTIKSRLNRISDQLKFIDIKADAAPVDVLDRLESGEIAVEDAISEIKKGKSHE